MYSSVCVPTCLPAQEQVCQEVDRSHAQVAEHLQEKELLVAERTQVIVNLQVCGPPTSHQAQGP